MTITQTVDIPANHRLVIDVPSEVPAGPVVLTFTPAVEQKADAGCMNGEDCPLHTENPPFNAKVLAAIAEGDALFAGEKPAKWYTSLEEAKKDLGE